MGKQKHWARLPHPTRIALLGTFLLCGHGIARSDEPTPPTSPSTGTRTQPVQPAPEPGSALGEIIKKGATMEEIAQLRDPIANTPEEALRALKTGNARFYGNVAQRPEMSANERRAQILSQTPFAVIVGCSDSRVPIEIVYDQGLGSIFSIRVAGNVIEPGTLGSIEYGVNHLKSHIVVVMGHEGCGAVKAAMLPAAKRNSESEHVRFLLDLIEPSLRTLPTIRDEKARMREAVIANVRLQVHKLKQNPVIEKATKSGKIMVVGAFYEIGSGAVDFLETPEELRLSTTELDALKGQLRIAAQTHDHDDTPKTNAGQNPEPNH